MGRVGCTSALSNNESTARGAASRDLVAAQRANAGLILPQAVVVVGAGFGIYAGAGGGTGLDVVGVDLLQWRKSGAGPPTKSRAGCGVFMLVRNNLGQALRWLPDRVRGWGYSTRPDMPTPLTYRHFSLKERWLGQRSLQDFFNFLQLFCFAIFNMCYFFNSFYSTPLNGFLCFFY